MEQLATEAEPSQSTPAFLPDQAVSVSELHAVVDPQNTLDSVEKARLRMVSQHVTELLRSDLSPQEASRHANFIHSLGAEAVLEYLPSRTV